MNAVATTSFAIAGLLFAGSARAAVPVPSQPLHIKFPAGDEPFPGGASAEAINRNCLICHSSGMVLNQPALSPTAWSAEVGKMIKIYKAPIDAADVPAIEAYLQALKPTP